MPTDEETPALSEEAKTYLEKTIAEQVKAALKGEVSQMINGHGKKQQAAFEDLLTKQGESLKSQLEGAVAPLADALKAFRPGSFIPAPPGQEGAKPEGNGKPPEGGAPPALKLEDHPEWKAQQNRLRELEKAAKQAAEEKAQIAKQRREEGFKSRVLDALAEAGVKDTKAAKQAFHVLHGEGLIRYSDEGKGDDVVFVLGGAEVDVTEGAKAWAKTEDGRRYLPAKVVPGSGTAPRVVAAGVTTASGNGSKTPKADALQRLKAENRAKLPQLITAFASGESTVEDSAE